MNSVRTQAKLLALILFLVGVGSIIYQAGFQKVPLQADEADAVWVIDTQVTFDAKADHPVKAQLFIPQQDNGFSTLDESFVSHNFGVNINDDGPNRQVTWSARRASGHVNLYYRLILTPRFASTSEAVE